MGRQGDECSTEVPTGRLRMHERRKASKGGVRQGRGRPPPRISRVAIS